MPLTSKPHLKSSEASDNKACYVGAVQAVYISGQLGLASQNLKDLKNIICTKGDLVLGLFNCGK